MRVGLVLGAGGVVGASWLIGALDALESETGWRAVDAQHIVGTSAGAVVGALAASGISSEYMSAYAAGRTLEGFADAEARADDLSAKLPGTDYRLQLALPPIGPGSWRLALNTMRHVRSHAPAVVLAGWLPRGFISTRSIHDLVDGFVPGPWPDHPGYWAVAADYNSGKRVAFGRHDAPDASAAAAVAASCAIPGFYHPVKVAGQRYVDGGICSTSNLDLLCGADLDLVVCLNPMSSVAPVAGGSPADRFARVMRAAAGRRLAHEARHDPQRLAAFRRQDIIFAIGGGDPVCDNNRDFSALLWGLGVGNALRIWDGHAHDWPHWEKMVRVYIGGHD